MAPPKPPPFTGFRPRTTYEITITPSDTYQYLGKKGSYVPLRERVQKFGTRIQNILNLHGGTYSLNIELSEKNYASEPWSAIPRLHLHGTLTTPKPSLMLDFLSNGIMSLNHFHFLINDYRIDYWDKYCSKQNALWQACGINNSIESSGKYAVGIPHKTYDFIADQLCSDSDDEST